MTPTQTSDEIEKLKSKIEKLKNDAQKTNLAELAHMISKYLIDEKNIIVFEKKAFRYKKGVFDPMDDVHLTSKIRECFIKEGIHPRSASIKEAVMALEDKTYSIYKKEIIALRTGEKDEICLNSSILDMKTLTTRDYTKNDFVFAKLPFDYDKDKKIEFPAFRKFLETTFEYDENGTEEEKIEFFKMVKFIQEWMGYSLQKGNKYHKALLMIGDGRNGKGVFIDIWSKILGMHNVSWVDIEGLNDRREIELAHNKMINFSPDIKDGQQLDTGVIKTITAGELVIANPKYGKPYNFTFSAKIVIAGNELPYIRNIGSAMRERIHIIPFNKFFTEEERDPDLKNKLASEAADIFHWAIEGLQRLEERKGFEVPEKCEEFLESYMYENDSVKQWVDEDSDLEFTAGVSETARRLYLYYAAYTKSNNKKPVSNQKFYKMMGRLGFKKVRKKEGHYLMNVSIKIGSCGY